MNHFKSYTTLDAIRKHKCPFSLIEIKVTTNYNKYYIN